MRIRLKWPDGVKLTATFVVCPAIPQLMSKGFVFLVLFLVAFVFHVHSQARVRGSVRGIIADTAGKAPMSDATVSVTPELDTADAQFAITDKRGGFAFKGLDPGKYHLIITFQGYRHVRKDLPARHTAELPLNTEAQRRGIPQALARAARARIAAGDPFVLAETDARHERPALIALLDDLEEAMKDIANAVGDAYLQHLQRFRA